MSVDIEKLAFELRELVDNYYNQCIAFDEYRKQRNNLLDEFERSLNATVPVDSQRDESNVNENILGKVLGLLKKNEKEILSE